MDPSGGDVDGALVGEGRRGGAVRSREIDPRRAIGNVARERATDRRLAERAADRVVGVCHRGSTRRPHELDAEDRGGGCALVGEVDVPDLVQRDGWEIAAQRVDDEPDAVGRRAGQGRRHVAGRARVPHVGRPQHAGREDGRRDALGEQDTRQRAGPLGAPSVGLDVSRGRVGQGGLDQRCPIDSLRRWLM